MQSLQKPVSISQQYDTIKCDILQKSPVFNEANWGGKLGEDNADSFTSKETYIELVKLISINHLPAKAFVYFKRNSANVKIMYTGLVTDANGTIKRS